MFKKFVLSGATGAALLAILAGCSQNEVARPGTVVDDLFAPTNTTAVTNTAIPAIPVAEPQVTTFALPEPAAVPAPLPPQYAADQVRDRPDCS